MSPRLLPSASESLRFIGRAAGTLTILLLCAGISGCRSNRFKNIGSQNEKPSISVDFKPGDDLTRPDEPSNTSPTLRSSVSFDDSWKRAANFSTAEGIVKDAYNSKEVVEGYELMTKGDYQKALDTYRRAQTKIGSNPFVNARVRHAELLIQSDEAGKNRALSKALEIIDEDGRATDARNLAEEALGLNPNNLYVRKETNRIIYETVKAADQAKAREAKRKMIDAARMIQDIQSQSEGFLFNFREER